MRGKEQFTIACLLQNLDDFIFFKRQLIFTLACKGVQRFVSVFLSAG